MELNAPRFGLPKKRMATNPAPAPEASATGGTAHPKGQVEGIAGCLISHGNNTARQIGSRQTWQQTDFNFLTRDIAKPVRREAAYQESATHE